VILARAETEVAATVSQTSSAPVAPNQTVLVEARIEATSGDEPPAQPQEGKAGPETPTGPSWQRHVLGTDEAIEQFDRDHPDLSQPRREEPPQTENSQDHGSATGGGHLETIDRAIEDLSDPCVGETIRKFNHITI
jgi:hypothetical protein